MTVRFQATCVCICCLLILGASVMWAQTPNPNNAGIYSKAVAPASSLPNFLASDQGGQMLLHSPSVSAKTWLAKFHPDLLSQYPQSPTLVGPKLLKNSVTAAAPTLSSNCAGNLGTGFVFNNEPALNAVPQNEPPVDFILNGIPGGTANPDLVVQAANDFRAFFTAGFGGLTGVYVHRNGNVPCFGSGDFEMGLPPIAVAATSTSPADSARADGDPHVIADPARKQFIVSDLRFGAFMSGVGLTRIPTANLLSTTACPSGTQIQPTPLACITTALGGAGTGGATILVGGTDEEVVDFPQATQDPRSSGTGAGDIYVVYTTFEIFGQTEINISACKALFVSAASCSPPTIVSGTDLFTQWSSVDVMPVAVGTNPAGTITITYVNFATNAGRFVHCTPHGAPLAPTCSTPANILLEPQPVNGLLTDNVHVRNSTIPVHADRSDGTIFVVWERCKVVPGSLMGCPDADVVMTFSTNMGATWAAMSPVDITTGTHEMMPAISIDPNTNITNITYYHSQDSLRYKNRMQVLLRQIPSGSTIPGAATQITTAGDSTDGDVHLPFFQPGYGDYMGNAAHGTGVAGGSHLYVGHNNNSRLGSYGSPTTVLNTEQNNQVSEFVY